MTVEIEFDLKSNAVPDYAMYTELGNAGVHGVVVAAKLNSWTWSQTLNALRQLAETEVFGEAMDTMVREYVYDAIGAGRRGEDFWA
jgi:2-methylisocitrate lyase-like PEP mutase family enzyme